MEAVPTKAVGVPSAPTEACWVCGTPAPIASDFNIVHLNRCSACGFLFQPALALEELRSHHDEEYFEKYSVGQDYDGAGFQRRREARIRLGWMRSHGCLGGRLLEVGAARGDFLAEARSGGFEPLGIEPERGSAEEARRRSGAEVLVGWAEELNLPASSFDAVCMWHVLEHIPRPLAVLRALRRSLKPGGRLFCEVPNAGSVMARAQGDRWDYLDPDHHVGFFDPGSLQTAFGTTGFDEIETVTVPMFRYAPPTASTVVRRLPRRLASTVSLGVRPLAAHPWKQDLLRGVARRPA